MIIIAIVSLVLGVIGGNIVSEATASLFSQISVYILYILMFSVGIGVGSNKSIFKKLKAYNLKILLVPIGVIAGSIIGGIISGLILKIPLNHSTSVSSAMGWYSLSGVLIADLAGADVGALAFLSNLAREFLSYLLIPFIAKYLNSYSAIACAGATSMDTALPIIIKYTKSELIFVSIISGVICSAFVPILIPIFISF